MADETLTAMVRAVDGAKRVDPLHDPRVSDLDVLHAARSILEEDGYPVDDLTDAIETRERGDVPEAGAPAAASAKLNRYLLVVVGDVEPELLGRFDSDDDRLDAARHYREHHGDEDGLYRVDADGAVTIHAFTGGELATLTW